MQNKKISALLLIFAFISLFGVMIIAAVFFSQPPVSPQDTNVSSQDGDGDGIDDLDDLCPSQAGPLSLGGCPPAGATATPTPSISSNNDTDGDGIDDQDDLCPGQSGPLSLGGCPAATATPTPTATNNPTSTPTVTYSIDGPTIKPTNTPAVTDTTQPSVIPTNNGTIEPTSTTTVTPTNVGQSSSTSGSNMIAILCGLSIIFMLLAVVFFVRRKKANDTKIVEKLIV